MTRIDVWLALRSDQEVDVSPSADPYNSIKGACGEKRVRRVLSIKENIDLENSSGRRIGTSPLVVLASENVLESQAAGPDSQAAGPESSEPWRQALAVLSARIDRQEVKITNLGQQLRISGQQLRILGRSQSRF
mmetsp:Transcript_28996/g.46915  ORF Transcript_28996/g.46915 Transcript_28996/m.46915 type:complete len:134 (+) Transcript_28996:104-505(+)